MRPNPAWAEKAIEQSLAWLDDVMPEQLPELSKELGCGHYGCVYETPDPRIVFKITSDPTEATVVAMVLGWKEQPEGMVRYYEVCQLGELKRYGRPLFGIWRERLEEVGLFEWMNKFRRSDYDYQLTKRFDDRLQNWQDLATQVRSLTMAEYQESDGKAFWKDVASYEEQAFGEIDERQARLLATAIDVRGRTRAMRAARLLRACELTAELMSSEEMSDQVGEALLECLRKGMLLADVHRQNIGRAARPYPVWVISDPGHLVPIGQETVSVKIPVLEVDDD